MKVTIYSVQGKQKAEIEVKRLFSEPVRQDLIQRAFLAERSLLRQPYGADPLAGKRTSAHYHGRRGRRWSMMNRELARMKRIHNQGILNFTARFVSQAVKGRKAHPPKAEKIWKEKINKKEWFKALLSAIAATINKDLVEKRGHVVNLSLPIVIEDSMQDISKASDVNALFLAFGLEKELERAKKKKVRAGKGKMRGRKYRKKKGPLLIVSEGSKIIKAGSSISGLDIVPVNKLNVRLLAPGGHPGRLTIWSESAIKKFEDMLKERI